MGSIYKITNKQNGKIYIGQTKTSIDKRWMGHIYSSRNGNPHQRCLIDKAIAKYGSDSFIVEEIEKCLDSELNDREIFWIDQYQSTDKNLGYNVSLGGNHPYRYDYTQLDELYEQGKTIKQIADLYQCAQSTVYLAILSTGKHSAEDIKNRAHQYTGNAKRKAVSQYDLDGNYITSYNSIAEAHRCLPHITSSKISHGCKEKKGVYGGFQWRYIDDEPPPHNNGRRPQCRSIEKYTLYGQFICRYDSIADAELADHISDTTIINCCKRRVYRAKDFIYKYTEDNTDISEWVKHLGLLSDC